MPQWLVNMIRMSLTSRYERTKPDFIIGDDQIRRWHVLPRSRWYKVYLHQIMKSDDDRGLHDHPDIFNISFILQNSYIELLGTKGGTIAGKMRYAGQLVFRWGTTAHRIVMPKGDATHCCWSLFIAGPRYRDWGYWLPSGWIPANKDPVTIESYVRAKQDMMFGKDD